MNCRDTQRQMSAFLDGELRGERRDAFFDHIHACAECGDALGKKAFCEVSLVQSFDRRMEAPAAIRHNVMAAIAERNARKTVPAWRGFAWRPATAFATVLALFGAGIRTFTENFPPTTTQVEAPAPTAAPAPRIASVPPAPARQNVTAAPDRAVQPAVAPRPAAVTPKPAAPKPPAPPVKIVRPEPARSAPRNVAPPAPVEPTRIVSAVDDSVGTVSYVWAPDNVMNGRFLSRRDTGAEWAEASYDLDIRTHLQTTESTVVETTLKDGTHLKINESTEFIVQRAPTRENASWSIRLVRGELWVRGLPDVPIEIVAPGMTVRGAASEFSVRSYDGEDSAAMVVSGAVSCENTMGSVEVLEDQASGSVAGQAPAEAFAATDLEGHLEWAYRTRKAYNALDHGALPG